MINRFSQTRQRNFIDCFPRRIILSLQEFDMKAITALILTLVILAASLALNAMEPQPVTQETMNEIHQQLAVDLFNKSWELLLKDDRSPKEEAELLNTVHASLWHWRQIGQPINILRGEWMICHVYTLLEHREEALYHARIVMDLKEEIDPQDWDLAYCFEAMARVMALHGDQEEFNHYYYLAREAGDQIQNDDDRIQFAIDMEDGNWFGMSFEGD
jgi:hypothetical protein